MIINLTTSGLNIKDTNVIEKRLEPITLQPEICSLDIGSVNFPHRTFVNSPEWGRSAAIRMRESGVKPEIEVFDTGPIRQSIDWIEEGLIGAPPYFQLCMGVGWGVEATPENLLFMKNKLPLGIPNSHIPADAVDSTYQLCSFSKF